MNCGFSGVFTAYSGQSRVETIIDIHVLYMDRGNIDVGNAPQRGPALPRVAPEVAAWTAQPYCSGAIEELLRECVWHDYRTRTHRNADRQRKTAAE